MARITLEEAKEVNNYESEWFKINNGEMAVVQFFGNDANDIDSFATHTVDFEGFKYGRDVHCLREYGDPVDVCPLCAANIAKKSAIMLAMVDVETKKTHIWSRGVGKGNAFASKIQSLFNRNVPTQNTMFGIERFGEKLDTTYDIFKYDNNDLEPLDMSKYTKPDVEKAILKVTAEQMQEYLNTGTWNIKKDSDDTSTQSQPQRRRSQMQEQQPQPQQTSRRRRGG